MKTLLRRWAGPAWLRAGGILCAFVLIQQSCRKMDVSATDYSKAQTFLGHSGTSSPKMEGVISDFRNHLNESGIAAFLRTNGQPLWDNAITLQNDKGDYEMLIPTRMGNETEVNNFFIVKGHADKPVGYEMHRKMSMLKGKKEKTQYSMDKSRLEGMFTYLTAVSLKDGETKVTREISPFECTMVHYHNDPNLYTPTENCNGMIAGWPYTQNTSGSYDPAAVTDDPIPTGGNGGNSGGGGSGSSGNQTGGSGTNSGSPSSPGGGGIPSPGNTSGSGGGTSQGPINTGGPFDPFGWGNGGSQIPGMNDPCAGVPWWELCDGTASSGIYEVQMVTNLLTNPCLRSTVIGITDTKIKNKISQMFVETFVGQNAPANIRFEENPNLVNTTGQSQAGNSHIEASTHTWVLQLNPNYGTNVSTEFWGSVIVHELIHSFMTIYQSGNPNFYGAFNQHTQFFLSSINQMSSFLQDIYGISVMDANALALGGLDQVLKDETNNYIFFQDYDAFALSHYGINLQNAEDLRNLYKTGIKGTPCN